MTSLESLVLYGWNERVAAWWASVERGEWRPGRVVRVERAPGNQGFTGAGIVRLSDGEVLAATNAAPPAVGDWVAVHAGDEEIAIIHALLPRWSALTRQDPGDENTEQVLAANVDVVLIVAPLDRLRVSRIERELLVAWESGATPMVVLTKADLDRKAAARASDLTDRFRGTEVVLTSARTGAGLDALVAALQPNRTAVLFGPSGAGKSTLANALIGDDVLATGDVREGDHRGRHTTTTRQLIPLGRGGVLIDTPGLRSVGVWGGEEGLAAAFADVEQFTEACRFRDCRHESEPGCAVTDAVARGELEAARVESYRKLHREVRGFRAKTRRR